MKSFIGFIFGISVCIGLAYYDPAYAQVSNPSIRTCTNEGAGIGVCDTSTATKTNLPFKTLVQGSGITLTDGGASGITISGTAYSEGSWTPTIKFGGGSVGITYSVQYGIYSVIGNKVFISCRIALTNKGSSSGVATIAGLPFTSNSAANNIVSVNLIGNFFNTTALSPTGMINQNSSVINVDSYATGSLTTLSDTDFTNTTTITLEGFYTK